VGGSINRGSDLIGAGVCVNDWCVNRALHCGLVWTLSLLVWLLSLCIMPLLRACVTRDAGVLSPVSTPPALS